ncbi:hypothetical protein HF086_005632 [Spodoptera exigua]|uniref:Uncharacterized protein n=1 Tax=Spodoptera exigua TaxID=7107 RepID=A0A922MY85_SPOEX|nr:hypothetical protein HF086_005632 [Spodoptera exigua]
MGKGFDYIKDLVVNFKLDWCCWVIPVRIGLFITGYFNIILAVTSLVGIADDSFVPILVQVQMTILDDKSTKPAPMIAYSVELAFNVILLCALYRVSSLVFQIYVLILVRSILVEMRLELKAAAEPTLVMSTLLQEEQERAEKEKTEADVEAPPPTAESEEQVERRPETALETVDEHPREETTQQRE